MAKKNYFLTALLAQYQENTLLNAANCLPLVMAIFCVFSSVGCDGKKVVAKEDMHEINNKVSLNKVHDIAHRSHLPIDPLLCKDNPKGYLYFKVGDELFRVNEYSPLIIAGVYPELDGSDGSAPYASGIPKGCKENPLNVGSKEGIFFDKKLRLESDNILMKFNSLKFGISNVPSISGVIKQDNSNSNYFVWERRHEVQRIDGGDYICSDVVENLTHCVFKKWGETAFNQGVGRYIYNEKIYAVEDGVPFSFKCEPWANVLHCEASYRIYSSVKLEYSIDYKRAEDFNPAEFIQVDKNIRSVYGAMHVLPSGM